MNRYDSLMILVEDDFQQTTKAIQSLQLAVLEATIVFSSLAEIVHRMRMIELAILSDLLSKRSSRMMSKS